jgi:DNA-binding transcriptional MerR regulator
VRISELSERSGVPVATIKYYLREGLLSPGQKTSRTQAGYDDTHLARLRLIRAFLEVGGLTISATRRVLAVMDDETIPFGVAAGVASSVLPGSAPAESTGGRGDRELAALAAARTWNIDDRAVGWALAARVIDDYAALGRTDLLDTLEVYADAAERVAAADLRVTEAAPDRAAMTETVVVGTVLGDALLAGLRRMVHESISRERFPVPREHDRPRR